MCIMTAIMHAVCMQSSRLPRILGIARNNVRSSGCRVGIETKQRCQHGIHISVWSSKDKRGASFSYSSRFSSSSVDYLIFFSLTYATPLSFWYIINRVDRNLHNEVDNHPLRPPGHRLGAKH